MSFLLVLWIFYWIAITHQIKMLSFKATEGLIPDCSFWDSDFPEQPMKLSVQRESVISRYQNCLDSWTWKETTAGQ